MGCTGARGNIPVLSGGSGDFRHHLRVRTDVTWAHANVSHSPDGSACPGSAVRVGPEKQTPLAPSSGFLGSRGSQYLRPRDKAIPTNRQNQRGTRQEQGLARDTPKLGKYGGPKPVRKESRKPCVHSDSREAKMTGREQNGMNIAPHLMQYLSTIS
jgi:hypothetical protein